MVSDIDWRARRHQLLVDTPLALAKSSDDGIHAA